MAATEVFRMNNPNETCTAAALTWSYMLLARSATPRAALFSASDQALKLNMDNIKKEDGNPDEQAALMGLEVVRKEMGNFTSTQIALKFKTHAPHVGIFWCRFHTVAYSYGHLNKQYFDNNVGLYKAKKTATIVTKMEEVRNRNHYGNWKGYIVVKLKPRFRM